MDKKQRLAPSAIGSSGSNLSPRGSGSYWLLGGSPLLIYFAGAGVTFGMLALPVLLTFTMLSGSLTPLESMPVWLQNVMQLAPTTHFVSFAQAVLYRGANG